MATLLTQIRGKLTEQALAGAPMFDYYLNDPSTPNLIVKMGIWALPAIHPSFRILNWNGIIGVLGSYEAQCCQIHNTIAIALECVQKSSDRPVDHWAAARELTVYPHAGVDFNAYYDRSSLKFFYAVDPNTRKTVYTCESSDIVAHELGHALLDSVRPDLWSVGSLEVFAFHESFGDIIALLKALQHEELLQYMINQTGGNLEISNVVSGLAEELGTAIYRHTDPLRNALNQFIYSPPESLPDTRNPNELGREPHSFSRVFTGACYDILTAIYNAERLGAPAPVALRTARDVLARLILNALPISALSPRFYSSVAQGMLSVDRMKHGGIYTSIIGGIFSKRNIYHAPIPMPLRLSAPSRQVQKTKLEDIIVHIAEPLHNLGAAQNNSALNSAIMALKFLHEHDKIGNDNIFSVVDGELVRNRICGYEPSN